jgi:iron complex transport system ATP-binding protein
MTAAVQVTQATVMRGSRRVLDGVSLTVEPGELVGLIGPNGSGKTTLMRATLGLLPLASGTSNLASLKPSARARAVAWLPQSREIAWPVSVETVVALGRLPHLPRAGSLAAEDRAAVDAALAQMNLTEMRHRIATDLSGGEQVRVLIARTLAQGAPILMADEPIAGLDPGAQIASMRVFSEIAASGGTVMVSLHDLGLAARHCSRLILLDRGRIAADGAPATVLTAATLASVFGITAHFTTTADGAVFQALETVA